MDKIKRYTTPFVFESGGIVMKEDDSNCEVCLSPNVSALEAEIERLKAEIVERSTSMVEVYKGLQAERDMYEAENEAMRCCGNCKKIQHDSSGPWCGYEKKCIRCEWPVENKYKDQIDNWHLKENN